MKGRDLRIGNIVNFNNVNHIVLQVGLIDCIVKNSETGEEFSEYYKSIKPIKITKEWLVNFGLKKSGNHYFFKTNIGSAAYFTDEFKLVFSDFERSKVDYVHEIQNLYFSLTLEELGAKATV